MTELSASTDKIKALLITCSRMGRENDRKGGKEGYRKSNKNMQNKDEKIVIKAQVWKVKVLAKKTSLIQVVVNKLN